MTSPLGHTLRVGYSWKLCPYSSEYKAEYYDNSLPGPSNHVNLFNNPTWYALTVTDHPTTSGTMVYRNPGTPGWMCTDTACYYYVTENPGQYFFES